MKPNARHAAAAALLLITCAAAHAQLRPFYVGASQTFGYDSNIFRLNDHAESSGLISTTQLLAGVDERIGRQRVYADARAGYSRYASQSQLDAPRYAVTAGVDWDTVQRLSGKAELSTGRQLGAFGDRDIPTGRGDNDQRYLRALLVARLGDVQRSRLWFEAEAVHDRVANDVDYTEPLDVGAPGIPVLLDRYERDVRSTSFGVGARWRQSGALVVGAGLRTERRSRDIDRFFTAPVDTTHASLDSRRNDIDLVASFDPSGPHRLRARLSYGRTDYDSSDVADRSGFTGVLRWLWQPTAKVDTDVRLMYDTQDREFGGTSDADGLGDRKTATLEARARWAATAKVNADASLRWYRRSYDAGFTDRDVRASVGASWAVLRHTTLGCSLARERRHADIASRDYSANLASCYAQVVLQ